IEKDAGTLIDAPRNALKPQRDLALMEILNPCCHCIGEIGKCLDVVEKLRVALAVERLGSVGDPGGSLSLPPIAAIDDQPLVVALSSDREIANDRHEGFGLSAHRFVLKIKLQFRAWR